jgi:UV DNA damage repair endonuclease
VTHVGGVYGDTKASRARWVEGYAQCPGHVRRRLVLGSDDAAEMAEVERRLDQGIAVRARA